MSRKPVRRRLTETEAYIKLQSVNVRGKPNADDSFIVRIAKALDVDLARLSEICDTDPVDFIETITAAKGELVEFDVDPMWHKLWDYVNARIAMTMAVRLELEGKMHDDRKKQFMHRMRQER